MSARETRREERNVALAAGVRLRVRLGLLAMFACCIGPALRSQTPAGPVSAQQGAAARRASETNVPVTTPAPQGTNKQGSTATVSAPAPAAPAVPDVPGEKLDQVVAIVNGKLVLDSDVDQERRFEQFQPYLAPPGGFSRDRAIERLINRDLILQQAALQPGQDISDEDVTKQLDELRKEIPACQAAHCNTESGWRSYLATRGFTEEALQRSWKQRMQVLAFIEERFRSGINITPADIKAYYTKSFLPEYEKQGTPPAPALEKVSGRIHDLLLQQQVSSLLGDWLRSLRAQGGIVVLHPGEEAP